MKKLLGFCLATAMLSGVFSVGVYAATATPSNAKVLVNEKEVAFQAYTIDGNTYFKLRDIDIALDGTKAGFKTGYDAANKAITLTTGAAYISGNTISNEKVIGNKVAKLSDQKVLLDGKFVVLKAYNIDGYNYFKLRDLEDALGFQVGWDKVKKVISITSEEYFAGYQVEWKSGVYPTYVLAIFEMKEYPGKEYAALYLDNGSDDFTTLVTEYEVTDTGINFNQIENGEHIEDDIVNVQGEEFGKVWDYYNNVIEPLVFG